MMSIIHYISASRRLTESEKTVYMLGGEREAPPMILAQRDMIRLEKKYYEDRMYGLFLLSILAFFILAMGFVIYKLQNGG